MKEAMLWDKEGKNSVRASKVRNFSINSYTFTATGVEKYELRGWYNSNEAFYFGMWDTEAQARMFLDGIHKHIER